MPRSLFLNKPKDFYYNIMMLLLSFLIKKAFFLKKKSFGLICLLTLLKMHKKLTEFSTEKSRKSADNNFIKGITDGQDPSVIST